jgi:hypothetical protein
MSFGKNSSQQQQQSTTNQSLDPQIKGALLNNAQNAQNIAYNTPFAYQGQLVAPLNANQNQGFANLEALAASNPGGGALNSAVGAATGVAGYNPNTVTPQTLASTDLSPYLNPYLGNVAGSTLALLGQQHDISNMNLNQQATNQNAFGGDRQLLAQALNNGQWAQSIAPTIANIFSQGYTNAQGAAQGDIANNLAAQQANQNAGLQGANLRLAAASNLGGLSAQQLAQGQTLAGIPLAIGNQQQANTQQALTAGQQQFQTNLGNEIALQQLVNQALGLAGNPTLTQSQSTGSGSSGGLNFGLGH